MRSCGFYECRFAAPDFDRHVFELDFETQKPVVDRSILRDAIAGERVVSDVHRAGGKAAGCGVFVLISGKRARG